jgi:hypothetical protein
MVAYGVRELAIAALGRFESVGSSSFKAGVFLFSLH